METGRVDRALPVSFWSDSYPNPTGRSMALSSGYVVLTFCQNSCSLSLASDPSLVCIRMSTEELPQVSSHIIFTNGLRDGWSTTSVTENLSPTIRAINFPNGAHHSDLRYSGPGEHDTEDIRLGYAQIEENLKLWLDEIKSNMTS